VVRYLQTNIIRVGCSAGSFLGSPRALSDNFLFHLWGHDEPDAGAVRVSDLRRWEKRKRRKGLAPRQNYNLQRDDRRDEIYHAHFQKAKKARAKVETGASEGTQFW
jgi:hypothetical protein